MESLLDGLLTRLGLTGGAGGLVILDKSKSLRVTFDGCSGARALGRMRSLYLRMLVIVILFVSVFSAIDIGTSAFLASQIIESLDSLPSHFRWGTAQSISAAQFYSARNAIGNISGIERAELRSQDLATVNDGLVDVFAVPNGSIAYTGLTHLTGSTIPGPGQVIVIANSDGASNLHIGQVIQASFLNYANSQVSFIQNLTVAGFAEATIDGFGYLTNSELTGQVTGNIFSFTTLIINWDDVIPSLLDFVNANKAEPPATQVFSYARRSDFSSNLDVGFQLSRAQSIEGRIASATLGLGGSTDSWLIGDLQMSASQVSIFSRVAIYEGVLTVMVSYPITSNATRSFLRRSRLDEHSETGPPGSVPSNHWDVGLNFLLKSLLVELGGVLVGILAVFLLVSVVTSIPPLWMPSPEGLSYSAIFGVGVSIVVLFSAMQTMKNSRIKQMSLERGDSSKTL